MREADKWKKNGLKGIGFCGCVMGDAITLAPLATSGRHVVVQFGACPHRAVLKPTALGVPDGNVSSPRRGEPDLQRLRIEACPHLSRKQSRRPQRTGTLVSELIMRTSVQADQTQELLTHLSETLPILVKGKAQG